MTDIPTYTPNNMPFGWRWLSIDGVNVEFRDHRHMVVGEVKLVSADGKAWHVRAHLYKNPRFKAVGNWRQVETLGNFKSKQEAIVHLIARHTQHKLEGNP